jgi:hypothetical protein
MAEISATPELPPRKETPSDFKIVFEPGRHVKTQEEEESLKRAFDQGNYDAHGWNTALVQRVRQQRPKIITLDGSYTSNKKLPTGELIDHTWLILPDSPASLNGSEQISIVKGDQLSPKLDITQPTNTPVDTAVNNQMIKDFENADPYENSDEGLKELGCVIGAFAGAGIVVTSLLPEFNVDLPFDYPRGEKLARRRFVQGVAGLAGLGIFAKFGYSAYEHQVAADKVNKNKDLKKAAALARDRQQEIKILEEYHREFPESQTSWILARNALYSLKTRGAYQALGVSNETPATIVAGNDHVRDMDKILTDEAFAGKMLRDYVKGLFSLVDKYYTLLPENHPQQLTPEQAKAKLVDYIALTSIDTMHNPDREQFKHNPRGAVLKALTVGSPYRDQRTYQALAPLL